MKWWKKTEDSRPAPPAAMDKRFQAVNSLLKKWALLLQQMAAKFSAGQLRAGVGIFCAGFLGLSMLVVVKGLTTKGGQSPAVPWVAPTTPGIPVLRHRPSLQEREAQRIGRLRASLDSLYQTERGKRWRDSLLPLRPGLGDTLDFLQQYYSQKDKTEQVWKKNMQP